MNILIQKFGGTSVATERGRACAITHVKEAAERGLKVVVVVSAMGRQGAPYATDTLLSLIDRQYSSAREQDLLVSCGETISAVVFANELKRGNVRAAAFAGARIGLVTDEQFSNARIKTIDANRLVEQFSALDVLVVAGFQGITENGDIATLGRGGSDVSATALGAALKAEAVHIFTDVVGVMTADPSIVKNAKPLANLTYDEVCHMANEGAKVIHPRAVEIAKQAHIPIYIRSTYTREIGTTVSEQVQVNDRPIIGIAYKDNVTQIKVQTEEHERTNDKVFNVLADHGISIDFINIEKTELTFTVQADRTEEARAILTPICSSLIVNRECAKVSAVGAGMENVPGVMATIVAALSKEKIQILQAADSHATIWVLIRSEHMHRAVNALHTVFKLEHKRD